MKTANENLVTATLATVREIETMIVLHGDNGLLGMRLKAAQKQADKAAKAAAR